MYVYVLYKSYIVYKIILYAKFLVSSLLQFIHQVYKIF